MEEILRESDLPIFTDLGYGVFQALPHNKLKLLNPPLKWIEENFGSFWNSEQRTLTIEPYSVLGSYLEYCLEQINNQESIEDRHIVFDEKYDNNHFNGQVMSYVTNGTLLFIIRRADELDSISQAELQSLRSSALARSNFETAREEQSLQGIMRDGIDFSSVTNTLCKAILDNVPQPVMIFSATGELWMANHTATVHFPNVLASSRIEDFSKDAVSKDEAQLVIEKISCGFLHNLSSQWEIGAPIPSKLNLLASPILEEDNSFLGSVLVFSQNDSSSTDYLEKHVSEMERMEIAARLAGGVAHDFNNLLAIILGNLSLLSLEPEFESNTNLSKPLNMATAAGNKAVGLVQQLLGYSRNTRLSIESVCLSQVIHETVDLFCSKLGERSNFSISVSLEDNCWPIKADREQLIQVLINLFENSMHACETGGELVISSRNFILSDSAMANALDCKVGHYVILTTNDNGCGINADAQSKVFEPFFTTKEVGKGTGLGMANAMGVIRQHGGHITCTSVEGQGTAFSLYLPRCRDTAPSSSAKRCLPSVKQRDCDINLEPGILVVDDEELLRNLVRTLCEKKGYRTFGACHGQEALEIIQDFEDEILAIVLDLAMPCMTGNELFTKLNEEGYNIPVIVTSGFLVDTEEFISETKGEPYAIFSKPYQLNDLITKINEIKASSEVALPA